jgi:hypothetical protein
MKEASFKSNNRDHSLCFINKKEHIEFEAMLSILKFGKCPGSLVYRSNDNKPVLVSVQWEPHRQATLSLEHLEGKNNKDHSQKLFKPVNQAHFVRVTTKDAKK